jgi:lipopolysaccharide/colanic/teichoic acid biosynthesis glycosyltransferase
MFKRLFDFFIALFGIIFLSPVFVVVAVLIFLDSGRPIFFRQLRVGQYGVPFRIHKFRTMFVNSEQAGRLTVGSDSRITRSGLFLRKSKLDELPQLIDVFLGKMSFVGPRPEVQEFIDSYPTEVKLKVLSIKPGITDLASIEMVDENEILSKYDDPKSAYIDIILPIKQRYYVDYVDNQTIVGDVKIIVKTIIKIFSRIR